MTTHLAVSSDPELINFWRQRSASADQATAVKGRICNRPVRITPGVYPAAALRLSMRLRELSGQFSALARIAKFSFTASKCQRGCGFFPTATVYSYRCVG